MWQRTFNISDLITSSSEIFFSWNFRSFLNVNNITSILLVRDVLSSWFDICIAISFNVSPSFIFLVLFTLFFSFLHASLFFYLFSGFPFFVNFPRRVLVQVQCSLSFTVLVLPFSLSTYLMLVSVSSSIFVSFLFPYSHCSTLPLSFEITDFPLVSLSNSSNNCFFSILPSASFFIRKCINFISTF